MPLAPIIGKIVLGVFLAKSVVGVVAVGALLAHRAAAKKKDDEQ